MKYFYTLFLSLPPTGRSDMESKLTTVPFPKIMDGVWKEGGGSLGGGDGNVIGAGVVDL